MILNEQLIEDMFQDELPHDHIEQPLQEVSLNFTVTSRSSKPNKKDQLESHKSSPSPPELNIFSLAEKELNNFQEWMRQGDCKTESTFRDIVTLIEELEGQQEQFISESDLSVIKNQLFRKQNEKNKEICKECQQLKAKLSQIETIVSVKDQTIADHQTFIQQMQLEKEVETVKEDLLGKVEMNLLQAEIAKLNGQIAVLRCEKNSLERTFLFNKTKNSEMLLKMQLQKSKGLSAAKNSTNSSELLNRNETIVFIDPVESDVDEWIKFFESQKNRYMSMCKKEENERMKQLGRSFTKQEKLQLHAQGRLFIIFSSLKDIWKNLVKIRENTNSFMASSSSKSFLKQKFIHCEPQQSMSLKQQNERLNMRLNKLMKLNEYLLYQKQNLEEINEGLKGQRVRQNAVKNKLDGELAQHASKIAVLIAKIREHQEERRQFLKSEAEAQVLQPRLLQGKRCKKVEAKGSGIKVHRSSCQKVELA